MNVSKVKEISIQDYTYLLPEEYIARYPLEERQKSKLLVARPLEGHYELQEKYFFNLAEELPPKALIVRNNSKVIHARLTFQRITGAEVEILCLEPIEPVSFELSLQATQSCLWTCMIGNGKRWRVQDEILEKHFSSPLLGEIVLTARRLSHASVLFVWDNEQCTFGDILQLIGVLPIPPYLNRETEEHDKETYQTVYAVPEGSVAAPTAGLHFTSTLLDELDNRGFQTLDLTLHVGAGTFLPVKSDILAGHDMHRELITITREAISQLSRHLGNIVSVGTTSVRSLESLYHLGVKLLSKPNMPKELLRIEQWEAYEHQELGLAPNPLEALKAVEEYMAHRGIEQISFPTSILIAPGYQFQVVDTLITNFHQPESTLLLLIAAFVGEEWKDIYTYALEHKFRFLSYGDSSLLYRFKHTS